MVYIRHTLQEYRELAQSKGGECLSSEYLGPHIKLKWKCEKGHIWKATPNHIKLGGWCPNCAGRNKTIEDMHTLAESRGGKCLSTRFINFRTKLEWDCANGHRWFARSTDIQRGHWCPKCSGGISERLCREYFEHLFLEKFPKVKPKWLIGTKRTRLELDGYCERLKIAFEYQGGQHYKEIKFFHSKRSFEEQQKADQIKRTLCEKHGIKLIEIPDMQNKERLFSTIISKCMEKEIKIPPGSFNPSDFKIYSPENLKEMQRIAKSKGGKCLSKEYINSQTNLEWQCELGHTWRAIPNNIKKGQGCPVCANKKIGKYRLLSIEEMQKIAKSRGGKCLSKEYINANTLLEWKCAEGHVWKATPGNIKAGKWCAKCRKGKKRNNTLWTKRVCLQCRKEFEEKKSRILEGRGKFCSKECFDKYRKGKPKLDIEKITRKCLLCGKQFHTTNYKLEHGLGKYCSNECYYKSKKGKPSPNWNKVKIICQYCGKEILTNKARSEVQKFCNNKCRRLSMIGKALKSAGKTGPRTERILRYCLTCKSPFFVPPHNPKKYCKIECYHKSLENKPLWNKGTKGIMKPNKTSFKKGLIPWNKKK